MFKKIILLSAAYQLYCSEKDGSCGSLHKYLFIDGYERNEIKITSRGKFDKLGEVLLCVVCV